MNEEIKTIYIIGKYKSLSQSVLKTFVKKFPFIVERFFQDSVLLKNGITIIATNDNDCFIGKRNFMCYSADRFMEYCYEKAYDIRQNKWNELKEGLIGAISLLKDATDKPHTTIKDTFIGVLSKMQELEQGK